MKRDLKNGVITQGEVRAKREVMMRNEMGVKGGGIY